MENNNQPANRWESYIDSLRYRPEYLPKGFLLSVVYPLAFGLGFGALTSLFLGDWYTLLLFSFMLSVLFVANRNAYEPRHYWQLPWAVVIVPSLAVLLSFYDRPAISLAWSIAIPYFYFSVLHYRRALEFLLPLGLAFTLFVNYHYDVLTAAGYVVCLSIVTLLLYKMLAALELHYQRAIELASIDELTQLFNRRALNTKLTEYIDMKQRYPDTVITLALIDLDYFKNINDRFGHLVGDGVLTFFAGTLQSRIRKTDIPARYGGEEFALLLPYSSVAVAAAILDDCREQLARQPIAKGECVKFSAGIASLATGESLDGWLSRCDHALYEAKAAGRDCNRQG